MNITGDGAGATAVASVGVNGAITGISLTTPGTGYTFADVSITSANGSGATATAGVTLSGIVTGVTVTWRAPATPARPCPSPAAGGPEPSFRLATRCRCASTLPTMRRSGYPRAVLVVVPTAMPTAGLVQSIQYFNQATTGAEPTPSAGNLFHAYVLHATGVANEYTVLWDSGELTVPTTSDPVGVVETILVPNVPVTANDRIAFYGEGIPVDDLGTGADILSYPAPTAPSGTITLGGSGFPIFSQTRTYSFAANVIDTSAVVPLAGATATAYGGVDAVTLGSAGSGYKMPTVDFDMPDDPAGVQATAHALCVEADCARAVDGATVTITGVVVDNPARVLACSQRGYPRRHAR